MKKNINIGILLMIFYFAIFCVNCSTEPKRINSYQDDLTLSSVKAVINDALQWQISDLNEMRIQGKFNVFNELSWENAIFITSVYEWGIYTKDTTYINWATRIAQKNGYILGANTHQYHADNLVCAMLYADIYDETKNDIVLFPSIAILEFIASHPQTIGMAVDLNDKEYRFKFRWSWCDALFMAPQVFAKYASITGNMQLLDFMDQEFWAATDFLYSPEHHLFWRDSYYFDKKEPNGQPVFWGRGNAWVFAGLARTLPYIPQNYPSYDKFVSLFKDMAATIVPLQSAEGHWHTSMLDSVHYSTPEMSSTAFFTYALWWGMNNNLLDANKYLEPATKGWKAIVKAMQPQGYLGYVQAIGEKPESITPEMTEVYGPAAMTLAAIEILKFQK